MILGLALLTAPMAALLTYYAVRRLRENAARPVAVLVSVPPSDGTD